MICPSRNDGGQHCYHSTHHGPWLGIMPPPMKCCFCGQSPQQEHGPYAPDWGGTATGGMLSGGLVYCRVVQS